MENGEKEVNAPTKPVSGVLLAAGKGERLGGLSKAFIQNRSCTLLEICIAKMAPLCREIVVVVSSAEREKAESAVAGLKYRVRLVSGGKTRQDSLHNGVAACTSDLVLIHEVARPLCPPALFERVLAAGTDGPATACFSPDVRDAVVLVDDGMQYIEETLPKKRVAYAQTPQVFNTRELKTFLASAIENGWHNDSSVALCLRAGMKVRCVYHDFQNLKVTYPQDLKLLET